MLSIGCLLIGFYIPSRIAFNIHGLISRWLVVNIMIIASMLAWDATNYYVVYKSEPMVILNKAPWAYLLGYISLAALVTLSCSIASVHPETTTR